MVCHKKLVVEIWIDMDLTISLVYRLGGAPNKVFVTAFLYPDGPLLAENSLCPLQKVHDKK